ncbi:DNA/RNA helicase, super II, SNF2 [Desulfitobacterium hafniense]|uniref:DNA/RNA helicase, super II, SNF2 n=1 Tax=Desulfitobacterium hafniense TaxID=49338 RepID=A0A098AZI1_DESHA|nr:helicase-related protein [Desulfitobacterium hafniense]CDX01520.1 DNA/RNA helicase, super II, SNF2 [Desulfitobacterium hafniense]
MKIPKVLDNKKNRVVDELREELNKGSKLSVISAYFTIYAYAELKKELNKIDKMRFIFTEPTFVNKDKELIRAYYIERNNEKMVSGNEFEIKLRNEMKQAAIAKECADWLQSKAEIKSLKQANPAQPRLVYIENPIDNVSINGTVDFTSDGLGITPSNRLDSNMCLYGKDYTISFLQAFNELWEDDTAVQDVKQKVLEQMQVLYKENTPEFIYFVTLYNVFNNYLDELTEDNIVKSRTGFKNTLIWNKLYKFQQDGVMGAIDKIEKYNGCIIADSVGLGKTFTALAVMKYYELRNDRVLVIVPKKLRENWTIYTMNDKRNIFSGDRFNYDVLNHTDLSRTSGYSGEINLATVNWSNYDLVVIDESHNFRNNPPVKGRITRYERFMNDIIKAGVKTKVLMLSATPVNNKMNDIKNQIAFITEGKNDAFSSVGLDNLELILRKAQTVFNKWSVLPDAERTTESFVNMMDIDYFKLLDTVTIARSRKHIEKYYNLEEIGKFPTRLTPENRYPIIDTKGEFPPIESINKMIKKLTLCVYSPLGYVLPEKRATYEKKYDMVVGANNSVFKQADREQSLVGLMRVGILKRMESSINSFALTVEKILSKIDKTLEDIKHKQFDYDAEMDISDIDIDDEEYDNLMFGNSVKVLLQDMDLIRWQQDLLSDKDKLETILLEAINVTPDRDAKLIELRTLIQEKIKNPINPENKKVIVFTAFADTARYLYNNLSEEFGNRGMYSAIVTGSGDNHSTLPMPKELKRSIKITDINTVLTLFSPKSKECAKIYPEVNEYIDILIATDCISEGQNLQDCDYLINYDIHWNPVRIIQRFGRIDRIGSQNQYIKLVNFWATKDLDEYINLQQRVRGRMVLLDVSATGEENVIETDSTKEMKDLEYRKKQLQKLQTEVVDLEDISGGISITDLTFNDFKIELMEYMKTGRKLLDDAPNGMYAIAKIDDAISDIVKPGVIFTLKQVKGSEQSKEQNPLFPYYMVYITDDGEVKLSFLHAKKILDYYKKLCSGKNEVLKDLVTEFNKQTDDGRKMGHYSGLLGNAIENLIGKKQDIGVASLFSKGGTTMQKSFFDGIEDFELVTFLVLKG